MKNILILLISVFITASIIAQSGKDSKDDNKGDLEKVVRIGDRAAGIHNASNIGLFFENRGKLYPRRITQGPSGEFPINSTKHYIYRVNPWFGIPGNVAQSLHTTNEELEAVGGYHFLDSAQIAFSDKPFTWNPVKGWPVKDTNGNNIILSDQDSYCVYSDSNNAVRVLGLQVAQTGYAYGVSFAKNMLFYKYEITNNGSQDLNDFYFALYCDIDVGNISGGTPEYEDDHIDYIKDRNLVYFFDDGLSSEWPGGKTGFFGISILKTPEINGQQLGVTDMHYNLYNDDIDIDSVQYGIMSSSQSLYNSSIGLRYFHIGNNPNIKFDDPNTIPASGLDLVATLSSGPYTLKRGDTLVFVTAFVAGETKAEMLAAATTAQTTSDANFNLPKPPDRPSLFGTAGDRKATLFWNDKAENSRDAASGNYDFEGYRIYRTKDKGLNWLLLADYDVSNNIGVNTGLQYSFSDTTVLNGFEYWYTITAYDRGDEIIGSLESSLGNTIDAINTVAITPRSDAIGREAVSGIDITNLKTGASNYDLYVAPIDNELLVGTSYQTSFEYTAKKENGNLATNVTIIVTDSIATLPYKYGISFNSPNNLDLLNLTTGEIIRAGYNYPNGGRDLIITGQGLRIRMTDLPNATADQRPEQGDLITINFSLNVVRNNADTVVTKRPFSPTQIQSTTDGVIFSLEKPQIIKSVSRIGGTDYFNVDFSVADESLVEEFLYIVSVDGNGTLNGNQFAVVSVSNTSVQSDTVFNLGTFTFKGIQGRLQFPNNAAPTADNKLSVEVIKPVEPDIRDKYAFKIKGAVVDKGIVKSEMNKIRVVPNPYLASSLYEPEFGELRKEPLRQIQFINLPPECTIHIFTVDADIVKTIYHNSTNGTEVWNLRTEGGREIAPGIYIYVVKTEGAEYMERFAVIK